MQISLLPRLEGTPFDICCLGVKCGIAILKPYGQKLVFLKYMPTMCIQYSGSRFNVKMLSYQYRKSHCGDKTVIRTSFLHNDISYIGKTASLYWFSPLFLFNYKHINLEIWCMLSEDKQMRIKLNFDIFIWTWLDWGYVTSKRMQKMPQYFSVGQK